MPRNITPRPGADCDADKSGVRARSAGRHCAARRGFACRRVSQALNHNRSAQRMAWNGEVISRQMTSWSPRQAAGSPRTGHQPAQIGARISRAGDATDDAGGQARSPQRQHHDDDADERRQHHEVAHQPERQDGDQAQKKGLPLRPRASSEPTAGQISKVSKWPHGGWCRRYQCRPMRPAANAARIPGQTMLAIATPMGMRLTSLRRTRSLRQAMVTAKRR